jgi:hypothetical protein
MLLLCAFAPLREIFVERDEEPRAKTSVTHRD